MAFLGYPIPPLLDCVGYIGLGWGLRSLRVLTAEDQQVAVKLVSYATLPALLLQTFAADPLPPLWLLRVLAASTAHIALLALGAWLLFRMRRPQQRGLLVTAAVSLAVAGWGYPMAEALLGSRGVIFAALLDLASLAAVLSASATLLPENTDTPQLYKHSDGGLYRGEWEAQQKSGVGVYTYPSGARYEGEWRRNLKEGSGVYHYPKGGLYRGEWSGGVAEGLGLRIMRTGRLKAGRWQGGQLIMPMDVQRVATAAELAGRAAKAAQRLQAGGAAARQLRRLAVTAAAVTGGWALGARAGGLPPTLDAVTAPLAAANGPLALLLLGASLGPLLVEPRQSPDVTKVLLLRWGSTIVAATAAFAVNPMMGLGYSLFTTMCIAGLGPIPHTLSQVLGRNTAGRPLAAALANASAYAALMLAAWLGLQPLVAEALWAVGIEGTMAGLLSALLSGAAVAGAAIAAARGRAEGVGGSQAGANNAAAAPQATGSSAVAAEAPSGSLEESSAGQDASAAGANVPGSIQALPGRHDRPFGAGLSTKCRRLYGSQHPTRRKPSMLVMPRLQRPNRASGCRGLREANCCAKLTLSGV